MIANALLSITTPFKLLHTELLLSAVLAVGIV